jgi:hypothetical protein
MELDTQVAREDKALVENVQNGVRAGILESGASSARANA